MANVYKIDTVLKKNERKATILNDIKISIIFSETNFEQTNV